MDRVLGVAIKTIYSIDNHKTERIIASSDMLGEGFYPFDHSNPVESHAFAAISLFGRLRLGEIYGGEIGGGYMWILFEE